ncbi:CrcB-like family protein [Clavispora lusitaniae]|uniref:CrcB-like family protein n=1 Tax=Clavispora lusitaniae TaxID=36911 RepID=UPI00202C9DB2|nr:CrcB-like family protein [Clavispora lusitaniae]
MKVSFWRPSLCIVFFSIWGVLARMGLVALTTYSGAFLGGVIWANCAACFIMGLAVKTNDIWRKVSPTHGSKGAIPMYVGVTTGFCGTCSSFSSFILESFEKTANMSSEHFHYPNRAYGIMEALAVLIAHMAISASSYVVGQHAGSLIDRIGSFSPTFYRRTEYAIHIVGLAMYGGVIALLATEKHGAWLPWMFSCLFTPWAALIRYAAAKLLNPRTPRFPMGTFAVNVGGTLLLAVFTILSRGRRRPFSNSPVIRGKMGCHVLWGLDNGFCATVTTISTFVAELYSLSLGSAYLYGLVSVALGFVIVLLIVGSYDWAVGFTAAVC